MKLNPIIAAALAVAMLATTSASAFISNNPGGQTARNAAKNGSISSVAYGGTSTGGGGVWNWNANGGAGGYVPRSGGITHTQALKTQLDHERKQTRRDNIQRGQQHLDKSIGQPSNAKNTRGGKPTKSRAR